MTLKTKKLTVLFIPVVVVWIIDQVTKHWVRYSLELHRHEIIEGWLAFNYTQNPGMALGMDWLSTPAISSVAILATVAILIYILKTLESANPGYLFCMGLILGGAVGNITDRLVMGLIEGYGGILHGHVIDFIHFTLAINGTQVFPYIFNVADVAISTAIITMLVFHRKIMPSDEDAAPEKSDGSVRSATDEPQGDAPGDGESGRLRPDAAASPDTGDPDVSARKERPAAGAGKAGENNTTEEVVSEESRGRDSSGSRSGE